jgi:hypothetical protein
MSVDQSSEPHIPVEPEPSTGLAAAAASEPSAGAAEGQHTPPLLLTAAAKQAEDPSFLIGVRLPAGTVLYFQVHPPPPYLLISHV